MNKDQVFGVDATWLLRRQFHASNKGYTGEEVVVEGKEELKKVQDPNLIVVSFLQSLLKLVRECDYQYTFVCMFDRGTYRYRPKEKFTEYKATREYDDSYEACWKAVDIAIPVLRKLGINTIQIGGLEADDLGMYYAHNSKKCILHSADFDWLLSTTPTTEIMIARQGTQAIMVKYDELIKDHIKEPFDLALQKAFVGDSSDNITQLTLPCATIGESIEKYKTRQLPDELLAKLDRNLNLVRLDRILTDDEIIQTIKYQETLTTKPSKIDLITTLSTINAPIYMSGVLGKYNKLHNQ